MLRMCEVKGCQHPADVIFKGEGVCMEHFYEYEHWATILGVKKLFLIMLTNRGWSAAAEMVEQTKELWLASLNEKETGS